MVRVKRAYEAPSKEDGVRILVDRIWPRGVSKEKAEIDHWAKDLAPSTELRKWFGHDPAKWAEFKKRYRAELDNGKLHELAEEAKKHTITLVYSAKDEEHNQAVALLDFLKP